MPTAPSWAPPPTPLDVWRADQRRTPALRRARRRSAPSTPGSAPAKPPAAGRTDRDRTDVDGSPAIVRDADGNALGGLRLPQIEVPVATLSGEPGPAGGADLPAARVTTVPFTRERLAELYPSAEAYLAAYTAATDERHRRRLRPARGPPADPRRRRPRRHQRLTRGRADEPERRTPHDRGHLHRGAHRRPGAPFLATATHGPHMADDRMGRGRAGRRGRGRLVRATPARCARTAASSWARDPPRPYRTRVVVRRPADAAAFSGTVVVEWLNVSSGLDANPDWAFLAPELVRTGVAWVGVSAQCIGVEGGAVAVDAGEGAGDAGVGLKGHDPERYGSLDHPGDAFAYDIYSQVGAAVRVGAPGRARRAPGRAGPGHRRVPVRLRPHHLHRRRAPRRLGLRRLPRAQPGPVGAPARRGRHGGRPGAEPSPARRSGSAPTSTSR